MKTAARISLRTCLSILLPISMYISGVPKLYAAEEECGRFDLACHARRTAEAARKSIGALTEPNSSSDHEANAAASQKRNSGGLPFAIPDFPGANLDPGSTSQRLTWDNTYAQQQRYITSACASSASEQISQSGTLQGVVVDQILESATEELFKEIGLNEFQLPEVIETLCVAEKRLAYVERSTVQWQRQVVDAIRESARALEIDAEIESRYAFENDDSIELLSRSDIVTFNQTLSNDLSSIENAIQDGIFEDPEQQLALAEAKASIRVATLHAVQIAAWDSRIVDYAKENNNWALQSLGRFRVFADQVNLLSSWTTGVRRVNEAYAASEEFGIDDGQYEEIVAAREKENDAYEQQILADLEL